MQSGVKWWCMKTPFAEAELVRRNVSLPPKLAKRIDQIAQSRHVSGNRAMLDLLEDAVQAYDHRRAAFLELADRF